MLMSSKTFSLPQVKRFGQSSARKYSHRPDPKSRRLKMLVEKTGKPKQRYLDSVIVPALEQEYKKEDKK